MHSQRCAVDGGDIDHAEVDITVCVDDSAASHADAIEDDGVCSANGSTCIGGEN